MSQSSSNRPWLRKNPKRAPVGTTWQGIVHWDDIRTVDYLASRPEVDPSRIGCLGIPMGGYRTDFLAALDDRIQCAVSVGWMSTLRHLAGVEQIALIRPIRCFA